MKMEKLEKSSPHMHDIEVLYTRVSLLHDSVITLLSKNRIQNESIFLEVSIAFV